MSQHSPRVNHLLFADDTMFFCKTKKKDCTALLTILQRYGDVSGQLINTQKASVFFSRRTPYETQLQVKQWLSIINDGGLGKYLGLPEHFGRKKKDLFSSIVDRIRQKLISWSSRFLSGAGKMVMLKSVLASIPNYTMSCFQLQLSLSAREFNPPSLASGGIPTIRKRCVGSPGTR